MKRGTRPEPIVVPNWRSHAANSAYTYAPRPLITMPQRIPMTAATLIDLQDVRAGEMITAALERVRERSSILR